MFWLGVLIGLFAGTMIGFFAAGLCGVLARQDAEEELQQYAPEGHPLQRRSPNFRDCI